MKLSLVVLLLMACGLNPAGGDLLRVSPEFAELWSSGKAELTMFRLHQARYGELHDGYMTIIFVKEKISSYDYVKLEDPEMDGTEVLKCNTIRKFSTGIYDYSIQESIFTSIQGADCGKVLKASISAQDWCGHVYAEIDLRKGKYHYGCRSYFEGESKELTLDADMPEDGLISMIRIDPASIPLGSVKIIPSLTFLRLRHKEIQSEYATVSIDTLSRSEALLTVAYDQIERVVKIKFKTAFPYELLTIVESGLSGWGDREVQLTSRAQRISTEWNEYWNLHNRKDSTSRWKGIPLYSH